LFELGILFGRLARREVEAPDATDASNE
jgi:sec-independent protein translocase protein TatC